MGYSYLWCRQPKNLSYLKSVNWADSETEPKVWGRVEIQGSYLLFTCEDNIQVLQEERMLAQSGALRVADSWSVRRNKDSPYWIPERWTSNWQLYQAIFIFTTLDSSRPHREQQLANKDISIWLWFGNDASQQSASWLTGSNPLWIQLPSLNLGENVFAAL